MDLRRFDWALKTRGTDLDRWPAPAEARALLQHSAEARARFADALAADALADDPAPPECGRLLRNLHRRLAARTPLQAGLRCGMLLACTAAGVGLGYWAAMEPAADAITMVQAALVP